MLSPDAIVASQWKYPRELRFILKCEIKFDRLGDIKWCGVLKSKQKCKVGWESSRSLQRTLDENAIFWRLGNFYAKFIALKEKKYCADREEPDDISSWNPGLLRKEVYLGNGQGQKDVSHE